MMRWTACPVDGTPIDQLEERRGRSAKFCSPACRQKAFRDRRRAERAAELAVVAEAERILRAAADDPIPAELRERDRWVRWVVTRDGRKLPLRADSRGAASSSDPGTWTTYADAKASTAGIGVGFMLGGGIGCIDLDDVIDEEGRLADWAARYVEEYRDSAILIEKSHSGRGVHIFVRRDEEKGRKIRESGRKIEIYSWRRYIAVTGDRI